MLSAQRGICRQASKRLSSAVGSGIGSGIQIKHVKQLSTQGSVNKRSVVLTRTQVTASIDITSQANVSSHFTHVPES